MNRFRRPPLAVLAAWAVIVVALATAAPRPIPAPARAQAPAEGYLPVGEIGAAVSGLAADGRYAYLARGHRVTVWDLAGPDGPRQVGASAMLPAPPGQLTADDGALWARSGTWRQPTTLMRLDLSDPSRPRLAARGVTSATLPVLAADGGWVYLSDGERLLAFGGDLAGPPGPRASLDLFERNGGGPRLLSADGGRVLAGVGNWGIKLVGHGGPNTLELLGQLAWAPDPRGGQPVVEDVVLRGDRAYLAGVAAAPTPIPVQARLQQPPGRPYLRVVDLTTPAAPRVAGTVEDPTASVDWLTVAGDWAYAAEAWGRRLRVLDLASADSPRERATLELPGSRALLAAPALADGRLALLDPEALYTVDVTTPDRPRLGASVGLRPWSVAGLVAAGDQVWLADQAAGLRVVDIAEPEAPRLVGALALPDVDALTADAAAVAGGRMVVADRAGLQVVEGLREGRPRVAGSVPVAMDYWSRRSLAAAGTLVAFAAGQEGLVLVDVSNPARPLASARMRLEYGASLVALDGTMAYVRAATSNGLTYVDVSDPRAPRAVYGISPGGGEVQLLARDGLVYLLSPGSLQIVDARGAGPVRHRWAGRLALAASAGRPAMTLVGDLLYVAGDTLQVVDVSLPDDPIVLASVPDLWLPDGTGGGRSFGIGVTGRSLALAQSNRAGLLLVAEAATPPRPARGTATPTLTPPAPAASRTAHPPGPSPTTTPARPVGALLLPWLGAP